MEVLENSQLNGRKAAESTLGNSEISWKKSKKYYAIWRTIEKNHRVFFRKILKNQSTNLSYRRKYTPKLGEKTKRGIYQIIDSILKIIKREESRKQLKKLTLQLKLINEGLERERGEERERVFPAEWKQFPYPISISV